MAMEKYLIFLFFIVIVIFNCCNKTKDCQHNFDKSIPAVADDTYNSCMSVVKQYTHIFCDNNVVSYPYPYENEMGKTIKVKGYVTDVGHVPGGAGNFYSIYFADDTIKEINSNLDDKWYQFYKTLMIQIAKGTYESPQAFIRRCQPICDDFKNHIHKMCYIEGTLDKWYMDGPETTIIPIIEIKDTTDYYFE